MPDADLNGSGIDGPGGADMKEEADKLASMSPEERTAQEQEWRNDLQKVLLSPLKLPYCVN